MSNYTARDTVSQATRRAAWSAKDGRLFERIQRADARRAERKAARAERHAKKG